MDQIIYRKNVSTTLADLLAGIDEGVGSLFPGYPMYVCDVEGNPLDRIEVEQRSLSDGSIVFNIILSTQGDPNS